MKILKVLEKLERLLSGWGLSTDDWSLLGEWAMVLQDYKVTPRPGVVDICALKDRLPWKVKEDTQTIPPRDSPYFSQWISFTERTGFGVDIFPLPRRPFSRSKVKDSVLFRLPNGKKIRLNTPSSEVKAHTTMLKKPVLDHVKGEKVQRWQRFIEEMRAEAVKKGERELLEACAEFLDLEHKR